VSVIEQVQEGGVRRPTPEIQAQRLVELLPMPLGKRLQITGAPDATQNPEHHHQQQEPLWVAHTTAKASVWDGLEKAD